MTHPTKEELAGLIYDELDPPRRGEVEAHVAACAECAGCVAAWRDVRLDLAKWKLSQRASSAPPMRVGSVLRWAFAASVFIASGFLLAHLTNSRSTSSPRVDARLVEELRAELKRDLLTQLAALHHEYREGVDRQIREIEAERVAEYSGLRKDVETVALRTQEEFLRLTSAASAPSPAQPVPNQ